MRVFGASRALTLDGSLYLSGSYKLDAFKASGGLVKSSWLLFRHDPRNTGNVSIPFVFRPTHLSLVRQRHGTFGRIAQEER